MINFQIITTALLVGLGAGECAPAETTENPTPDSGTIFHRDIMKYVMEDLKPEKNALISPFNTDLALSLIGLGASGETRKQISDFYGSPNDEASLRLGLNGIRTIIETVTTSEGAEVKLANGVFVQKGLQLKDTFVQESKNYFHADVQQTDFAKGGSEATETINGWISESTKKRVPKLFKSDISPITKLLIASTLFFNATWNDPFKKSDTTKETFNTGVKDIQVSMMKKIATISYQNNKDLQYEAISLPYHKSVFSMAFFLPYRNSSIQALAKKLKSEDYPSVLRKITENYQYVEHKIPRIKFGWSESINQYIVKLGLEKIFQNGEFDNIVSNGNLQLSDLNHATEIEVHEDGTVASAVTSATFTRNNIEMNPEIPLKFHLDRPFLFLIYHTKVKLVLFSGAVQNPFQE